MKKRIRTVILSLLLCFSIPVFSVCASAQTSRKTPPGVIVSVPETVASDNVQEDPAYKIYDSYIKNNPEVIRVLYDGIDSVQSSIDLRDYQIPVDHIRVLMHLIKTSFPELFYFNGYRYSYSSSDQTVTTVSPTYTVENIKEKQEAFFKIAETRYLSLIDDSMDDFTKAVILHDALALNVRYADPDKKRLADCYTFFAEGWGVCYQYTKCYAYLLARCGIESEIIQSDSMNHAWLKIRLDGNYYNVDLTWDDPIPEQTGKVRHRYFLYSDSAFRSANQIERQHYGYRSIHPSDSTAYDQFENLHSFTTQLCYLDGAFYAITGDGKLVRYNHHTDEITVLELLPYRWPAGQNQYWVGNFSSLVPFNDKLYYNSPDKIYQYDPEKNESEIFAEITGEEKLYGLRIVDNQLWVVRADNPNVGYVTPTYIKDLPAAPHRIGDVDDDGDVTILDATAIQRHIADLPTKTFILEAADHDGDQSVTILDATSIQRELAGLA